MYIYTYLYIYTYERARNLMGVEAAVAVEIEPLMKPLHLPREKLLLTDTPRFSPSIPSVLPFRQCFYSPVLIFLQSFYSGGRGSSCRQGRAADEAAAPPARKTPAHGHTSRQSIYCSTHAGVSEKGQRGFENVLERAIRLWRVGKRSRERENTWAI